MDLFGSKLQLGRRYLAVWPRRPELNPLFPENRVIHAIEFGARVLPPVVVICLMLQYQFGDASYWPSVLTSLIFMLSMPLQGYYWLGRRAVTPLPPSLAHWYREINGRMSEQGCRRRAVDSPRYQELAETLKAAFDKLDSSFLYE
ncbi:terminus macrodomain insulation protein YfbV [Aeromonas schubertii]|uniref:UPF0208 membrane protein YfbV n=1 Tax=Aeromonas schubertii TaxID=652 RepID=A0ABS7VAJ4_9GAMM|nr:terminus macrodomain insulation protein YfbV [Aeromonas schubertii]KUE78440.1 hypothetical protein ATO46_10635 [Aeromonas schubertii]MBZ6066409.1 DUF412 domain-containing protein [Aeromonas schubertii]MBZ6072891.1 DUF412 domain-containing protein [Aeromonas schubertii]QCG47056.1 DUF412 domain-containing protein [Aeromonas schubertii]